MSAGTPGLQRPGRRPLIALLVAALTTTVALTLLAARAEDADNDDTASSSLERGSFRGNPLGASWPAGPHRSSAYATRAAAGSAAAICAAARTA